MTISLKKNSYSGDVTIPAEVTYNNVTYSVTAIGTGAFENCSGLTSIGIPESVTNIFPFAFEGCSSLTSINIQKNVIEIGCNAFQDCTSLASIKISEGVTAIESEAFSGCTSLTSIDIPKSVLGIGEYAFANCTALRRIVCNNSENVPTMYNTEECSPFTNVPSTCVLYLPNGYAENYKYHYTNVFGQFLNMDVTVTDAGWASGCLTYPAQAPSGTAYYISDITDNVATLTEFPDGLIPYNTGFLYKNEPGTYTFDDAWTTLTEPTNNLLKGTAETISVDAESIYVLGKNDAGVVGIRLYTGTELSGNKAYINVADIPATALKSLSFGFDGETTGISESVVTATEGDKAPVYNLQGQRVTTPRSGQIYIKNGKKFIK